MLPEHDEVIDFLIIEPFPDACRFKNDTDKEFRYIKNGKKYPKFSLKNFVGCFYVTLDPYALEKGYRLHQKKVASKSCLRRHVNMKFFAYVYQSNQKEDCEIEFDFFEIIHERSPSFSSPAVDWVEILFYILPINQNVPNFNIDMPFFTKRINNKMGKSQPTLTVECRAPEDVDRNVSDRDMIIIFKEKISRESLQIVFKSMNDNGLTLEITDMKIIFGKGVSFKIPPGNKFNCDQMIIHIENKLGENAIIDLPFQYVDIATANASSLSPNSLLSPSFSTSSSEMTYYSFPSQPSVASSTASESVRSKLRRTLEERSNSQDGPTPPKRSWEDVVLDNNLPHVDSLDDLDLTPLVALIEFDGPKRKVDGTQQKVEVIQQCFRVDNYLGRIFVIVILLIAIVVAYFYGFLF